jgi:hypothetical protein
LTTKYIGVKLLVNQNKERTFKTKGADLKKFYFARHVARRRDEANKIAALMLELFVLCNHFRTNVRWIAQLCDRTSVAAENGGFEPSPLTRHTTL